MKLSSNLLSDFAKALSEPKSSNAKRSVETTVYATVVSTSGTSAVIQIDGSDAQTPAVMVTDCRAGDRVTVKIKNHRATITGNITAPASARSEDRYMRFTDDGLMIGVVDTHDNPTGYYILIQNDKYLIKDQNGDTVASFDADSIDFIEDGDQIKVSNNVLYLIGKLAAGLRAESVGSDQNRYRAEVVVHGNYNIYGGQVAMQLFLNNMAQAISSVVLDRRNVYVTSPGGLVVNGYNALTEGTFLTKGEVEAYYTIGMGSISQITVPVSDVPSGYKLSSLSGFSIREPISGDPFSILTPRTYLEIREYLIDESNNVIDVVIVNHDTQADHRVRVRLCWLAYKLSYIRQLTPTEVIIN